MTNKITGFGAFTEASKSEKNKYDKLIKELEKLNSDNNEDVKLAIALLKQGRDLKENTEMVILLNKRMVENPKGVLGILENLFKEK